MSDRVIVIDMDAVFGPLLLSRLDGARARELVLSRVGPDRVIVDFRGVTTIAPGFADEFFARMPESLWAGDALEIEHLAPAHEGVLTFVRRRGQVAAA